VPKWPHPNIEGSKDLLDLDTTQLQALAPAKLTRIVPPHLTATLTATRVTNYLNSDELSCTVTNKEASTCLGNRPLGVHRRTVTN